MRRPAFALSLGLFAAAPVTLTAGELLTGNIIDPTGAAQAFLLTGENKDQVEGGTISIGERSFIINRVSARGLIGASRAGSADGADFAEYAVFSSSFSDQTANGQPWIASTTYHGCDTDYNSFLAVYRVNGRAAIDALGDLPYPTIAEDATRSATSNVYCFTSRPGADYQATK